MINTNVQEWANTEYRKANYFQVPSHLCFQMLSAILDRKNTFVMAAKHGRPFQLLPSYVFLVIESAVPRV